MPDDKSKSPFECLNDVSTEKDVLGFRPYVEAIAEFLTAEGTQPPITLSIEGQWGCGKSSFMKQLKEEIENKNKEKGEIKYFTVWFNSWKYDKEDELWASFALHFMDELSRQLSWKRRQSSRVKLFYLRYKLLLKSNFLVFVHFSWSIFSFILIFSFLSLLITYVLYSLGMPLPNFINDELVKNFSNFVLISAPFVGLIKYFSAEKWFIDAFRDPFSLKKLESNTNYKERLSFREHFHSDLNEIIKSYVGDSKVYVFIDDLDRCEVPKAAELMQAINLLISDSSKVYFSLAIDRKVISAGLAAKNEKVISYMGIEGLEYGYDFIEKFIQLPFKVPSPKSADFLKFLMSADKTETKTLLNFSEPADKSSISEVFTSEKLPEGDIKSVQNASKGNESESRDSNNVEAESDNHKIQNDEDCAEDPKISILILEMVSPALDNNPRRIKQFINQFRFQRTIGKRTGIFSYKEGNAPENMWNCKKLAKFVAISMEWPSLVSALGSNSKLLDQLQAYALKPENENKSVRWAEDERLISLLRFGCIEGSNLSQNQDGYTLSGLDFSKLLQISPVVAYPEESTGASSIILNEIDFVRISPGKFMMGSSEEEVGKYSSETPLHKVTITNPFYLGKYPVAQKQWIAVMGYNASTFKGDNHPVNKVSWNEAQKFITKLNEIENTNKYRLPSEAEWEYACRAGTITRYYFGDDDSKLGDYAWYDKNSRRETHPVGQKKPNPWGLHDMYGNIYEWVQDRWHDNYKGAPSDGSAWEDGKNSVHVFRGGGWHSGAEGCWSTTRNGNKQYLGDEDVGFRLVREL